MPSKFSQMRRPANSCGTRISVRYQYEVWQRLSGIISCLLFSPYEGSGYTLSFTSEVSTVPGTVAAYHPAVLNPADAIFSPASETLTTSCNCQPDEIVTGAGRFTCAPAPSPDQNDGTDIRPRSRNLPSRLCNAASSLGSEMRA